MDNKQTKQASLNAKVKIAAPDHSQENPNQPVPAFPKKEHSVWKVIPQTPTYKRPINKSHQVQQLPSWGSSNTINASKQARLVMKTQKINTFGTVDYSYVKQRSNTKQTALSQISTLNNPKEKRETQQKTLGPVQEKQMIQNFQGVHYTYHKQSSSNKSKQNAMLSKSQYSDQVRQKQF